MGQVHESGPRAEAAGRIREAMARLAEAPAHLHVNGDFEAMAHVEQAVDKLRDAIRAIPGHGRDAGDGG